MVVLADVVDEVRLRGGVVKRSLLPRYPTSQAVAAGLLVVPRRGVVALPETSEALMRALSLGGVLSCASAAAAHGLEVLGTTPAVHVTVPHGTRVDRPPGVVVHRRDVEPDGYMTTRARAAADCTRCLDPVPALVVVESALRSGVTKDEVLSHLWGRGSGVGRRLVAQADPASGSGGETIARVAIERAGMSVQSQVGFRGIGRVDLLVEGRLVVEIDGYSTHASRPQFAIDRRRDARLLCRGMLVVRFAWSDVVAHPDEVAATVREILTVWA